MQELVHRNQTGYYLLNQVLNRIFPGNNFHNYQNLQLWVFIMILTAKINDMQNFQLVE